MAFTEIAILLTGVVLTAIGLTYLEKKTNPEGIRHEPTTAEILEAMSEF